MIRHGDRPRGKWIVGETMWFIILSLALAAAVAGVIFLISRVRKFSFVGKISSSESGVKGTLVSTLAVLIFAVLLYLALGTMNAIVVFIVLALIWLICDLISDIFFRIFGKKSRIYYSGIIAIVLTALYLGIGYYNAVHVVCTEYKITTDTDREPLTIALVADSHVGTTMNGDDFARYIEEIGSKQPDVLVVAGDLFDDSTGRDDMIRSCEALGRIQTQYGVFYSFGNHDRGYGRSDERGYDADDFISLLKDNGVVVLEDEIANIGEDYCIIGREDKNHEDRQPISELMSEAQSDRYSIVIDHQPSDYDAEAAAGCNLVLSGHTHGGQMIPITYVGEWIKANDATYGYEKRGDTDFIVTSGLGDWEILFKTGCRSEYVMVYL